MVLPCTIIGTTPASVASILQESPFNDARDRPIQRSSESSSSVTVTLRAKAAQATAPPNASMMLRMGTSVLPCRMMGVVPWASIGTVLRFTDRNGLPIQSVTVVPVAPRVEGATVDVVNRSSANRKHSARLRELTSFSGIAFLCRVRHQRTAPEVQVLVQLDLLSLATSAYGWYVIVIVLVASAHMTEQPRFSETNLSGSIVLPLMISGTTLALAGSIGVGMPFTAAVPLPIQSSREVFPRLTVALRTVPSQPTDPPSASMIARMGTKVRPFLMTGGESSVIGLPATVNADFPI